MRIGLKPNKNEKSVFCFLLLPDGGIAGFKGDTPYSGPELSVNGLTFTKVMPEKRWTLGYKGMMAKLASQPQPVSATFDLEFEAMNRMFDYRSCVNAEKEAMSKSVVSEHLEQFGRITGTLSIGDKSYNINGLGERDHSWGVREWTAPKMWIWLTCQFSEKEALNVTKLAVEQGEVDAGFVHLNGMSVPLDAVSIDTKHGADGGPKSFHMIMKDKDDKQYHIDAEILRQVMIPFDSPDKKGSSIMYETLARYRMDGKTGYGIAEYLIKKS